MEDQCADVLTEAGAIPEPPEFGTGLRNDQVCSEITNNPSETNNNSQSKQILLLFLRLLEEDLGVGSVPEQELTALLPGLQEPGVMCDVKKWI